MTGAIDWLTTQLQNNPLAVAAVVALLAMSEAVLIVGTFVPGITIVLAVSAAAGASGHGLFVVFAATAVGTIAGDLTSYWIGRRYGLKIAEWGPLARRPHVFATAERYFESRGVMSVAIARFIPAVRTMVPTFAGITRMPPLKFAAANGVSGVVWAALHVFGAGLAAGLLAEIGGRLAAILVGVLVLIGIALWIAQLAAVATFGYVQRLRKTAYRWVAARRGRAARLVAWTLSPDDVTGLLVVLWAAILTGAVIVFAELTGAVWDGGDIVTLDLALDRFLQSFRTPAVDSVMILFAMLGDALVLVAVAAAVVAWLLWRRSWLVASLFTTAIALPWVIVPIVSAHREKLFPYRSTPGLDDGGLSIQLTNTLVLFGLLTVLVAGSLRGRAGWAAAIVLSTLALVIAFAGVYLQAELPSEAALGLALAIVVTAAFALIRSLLPARSVAPRGLAATVATALVLAGGANVVLNGEAARALHHPRDLSISIAASEWQDDAWSIVGPGRMEFDGDVETPFVLQWLGDRSALHNALAEAGWTRAPRWGAAALSALVSADGSSATVPPMPQLHLGRPADEIWILPDGERQRLVLRLWQSRFDVAGSALLVGAVEVERLHRWAGFVTLLDDRPIDGAERAAFVRTIAQIPVPPHADYRLAPAPETSID